MSFDFYNLHILHAQNNLVLYHQMTPIYYIYKISTFFHLTPIDKIFNILYQMFQMVVIFLSFYLLLF